MGTAGITEVVVEGGPTGTLSLRILRPAGLGGTLPVVVHPYAGNDRLIRELAARAEAAAVLIGFDRCPYPAAIEQCYAALEWAGVHGGRYRLDPDRIAVAGETAGANLAAAVTIMARQRSGPPLAAQVLYRPLTDAGSGAMPEFWDGYAPDPAARAEITCSPLRATTEQLAGLPPALVVVGEADVLRDEGEAYAAKLRAAGVPVTAVRYLGLGAGFGSGPTSEAGAVPSTPAARAAIAQGGRFLYDALH
jgi:acetyl esterase